MARPLKYSSVLDALQEMSDTELEYLTYSIRRAYADYVNTNETYGYITQANLGAPFASIGTSADTNYSQTSGTETDDVTATGDGPDYATAPPLSLSTTNYTFYSYNSTPAAPSNSTTDADSYLCYSTSLNSVQIANSSIITEVITQARNELVQGEVLGSFKVATSAPSASWTDKGTWFVDTRFQGTEPTVGGVTPTAATTYQTYNLYLATDPTMDPKDGTTPTVVPMRWNNSRIEEFGDISYSSLLVQNVLLPLLQRSVPTYTVSTTAATYTKGFWQNTVYTSETVTPDTNDYLVAGTYYQYRTPAGAISTTTYYLNVS